MTTRTGSATVSEVLDLRPADPALRAELRRLVKKVLIVSHRVEERDDNRALGDEVALIVVLVGRGVRNAGLLWMTPAENLFYYSLDVRQALQVPKFGQSLAAYDFFELLLRLREPFRMRDACEDEDHEGSAHGFNPSISEYTDIPSDLLLSHALRFSSPFEVLRPVPALAFERLFVALDVQVVEFMEPLCNLALPRRNGCGQVIEPRQRIHDPNSWLAGNVEIPHSSASSFHLPLLPGVNTHTESH